MSLPLPSPDACEHSAALIAKIGAELTDEGGWISFARFMELALYAPGLGYYAAGARKFGSAGDFVTAPEMTAFFGRSLARQVAQIMALSAPVIIEVGAGSGRLAADLLLELERLGVLPASYFILDLSADLRERQQATLAAAAPHLLDRVHWLDCLPDDFPESYWPMSCLMPCRLMSWPGVRMAFMSVASRSTTKAVSRGTNARRRGRCWWLPQR